MVERLPDLRLDDSVFVVMLEQAKTKLHQWYLDHRRALPWRENNDPYRIWVSEVMLQQTTVAAVVPFYERFMGLFPTLKELATAKESEVLAAWAGLGYYRRAKLLHQSAQALHQLGEFPQTAEELLELPGFGPYTSRAVASLAFAQPVGVLDGNVIRFLSRFNGLSIPWWEAQSRAKLQRMADEWVTGFSSADMNQALMEMGATVCTAKNPLCVSCPVNTLCKALALKSQSRIPRPRPRRNKEIWIWNAQIITDRQGRVALEINRRLPFLKGSWLLPGSARKVQTKPKRFSYKHHITHHEIFVTAKAGSFHNLKSKSVRWVARSEVSRINPSSLLQKALEVDDEL